MNSRQPKEISKRATTREPDVLTHREWLIHTGLECVSEESIRSRIEARTTLRLYEAC